MDCVLLLLFGRLEGEAMLVRVSVCVSVLTSVTNVSWNLFIIFFWNSAQQKRYRYRKKITDTDFLEKVSLIVLKRVKRAQNRSKMEFFLVFINFCLYFLLEVTYSEGHYNFLISFTNPISGKILVHKLWVKMLSIQLYCRILSSLVYLEGNILHFLHRDSTQGEMVSETTTAGWVWPGVPYYPQACLDLPGWIWLVWGWNITEYCRILVVKRSSMWLSKYISRSNSK